MTTCLSSSSSSSSDQWTYHVFPSFSGEDVRRTFLSHVHAEFKRKGIVTFKDNGIERSRSISVELKRAIQKSKIAIVVLSKNYASSSWCLDELLEIMKCKEDFGQTVIPIFYQVDPSNVRKQKRDFGRAFKRTCVGKSAEKKEKWRQALTDVAGLAGVHSEQWDDEADMIQKIATYVSNVLNFTPSRDFAQLVGIGTHMENMMPLLCLGSNEVRFVGIWGPAGIGKTTIARALFGRLSSNFDYCCFMGNVKGMCERTNNDIYGLKLYLQQCLLSEIFDNKDIRIYHLGVASERLRHHKVLLVLDDIDRIEQLEAVAKETQWFGSGSRIIVTTQNLQVLIAQQINHVYKVPFSSGHQALQIFSQYAFGQSSPPVGFCSLAIEIVILAGGLPLLLSVLGSSLRGRSKDYWDLALLRLKTSIDDGIEKTLKVGYECLSSKEKSIFLHIACLFNGETVAFVSQLLANSHLEVKFGLQVLAERSLIAVGRMGHISMHKLLEQLGREIVRNQSIHDPGKRQFLIDDNDIYGVLADKTGIKASAVLGISLNIWKFPADQLVISDKTFQNFPNLQFLRIFSYPHYYDEEPESYPSVSKDLAYFPPKLCLLEWCRYPMKIIPSEFSPKFLVKLVMPNSKLERLWEGTQPLENLRHMDLHGSKRLEDIPDLLSAHSLEYMNLSGCTSLVKLPSLRNLNKLVELDMRGCKMLEALPEADTNLESLRFLKLSGCSKLKSFPNISRNIGNLVISGTAVGEVSSSIRQWTLLTFVNMSNCANLKTFPHFPESVENLLLSNTGIEEVPPRIKDLSRLRKLRMDGCEKLKIISPDICKLERLLDLDFSRCRSVANFPAAMFQISCRLDLQGVHYRSLPQCLSETALTTVRELCLASCDFESIPDCIKHLSQLKILTVGECEKLISLPELPRSLHTLRAYNCKSLERISGSLPQRFHELNFVNCFKLNQEAQKLILQSDSWHMVFPYRELPIQGAHQARGSFLTVLLDRMRTPASLRFKAGVVLAAETYLMHWCTLVIRVSCFLSDQNGGCRQFKSTVSRGGRRSGAYTLAAEHLFIVPVIRVVIESDVGAEEKTHNEFVFEFSCGPSEITRCGVAFMDDDTSSDIE